MEKKKISNLFVYFSKKNMCIKDSYKINNIDKMKEIINTALNKTKVYHTNRDIHSFVNEWITHNFLYNIHIFRQRTKDCDFESSISIFRSIMYNIISFPKRFFYFLEDVSQSKKIIKKSIEYKEYIQDHKRNVIKAFEEIQQNSQIVYLLGKDLFEDLYDRVQKHDDSKYSKEEFVPYRKNFYPISQNEKELNKKDFEKAWEHHWKNNSHHWQYRQHKKEFNHTKEEILDVVENILDWMAMGYRFGDTALEYYMKEKNNIILCYEERQFLEKVLYLIYNNKEEENGK